MGVWLGPVVDTVLTGQVTLVFSPALLEAAAAGRADPIVTGDKAMQKLGSFRGIPIVSAAQFVAQLQQQGHTEPPGLAGLSRALSSLRILVHDRAGCWLTCAIADGARVISDFRVIPSQRDLFGMVASMPTPWRTLTEIAGAGAQADRRTVRTVSNGRRHQGHRAGLRSTSLHRLEAAAIFYPNFYPKRQCSRAEMVHLLVTATNWSGRAECVTTLPSWSCGFDSRRPLRVLGAQ